MYLSVRTKVILAASFGASIAGGLATHALAQHTHHHEGWDVLSPYDDEIAAKGYFVDTVCAIACGALALALGAISYPVELCCRPTEEETSLSSCLLPTV